MRKMASWHVPTVTLGRAACGLALVGLGVVGAVGLTACEPEVVFGEDEHWPNAPDVPAIGEAGMIVVTNSGDDTLSWIDPTTLEEVYRMPVGLLPPEREGPHHGAASPDGKYLYIGLSNYVPGSGSGPHGSHGTGKTPGSLLKYDVTTAELVGIARVSRSPGDVRITADGKWVVQTHFDLLKIQEEAEKGNGPEAMVTPIAIVDATTMEATLVDACIAPHGVTLAPDSKTAYAACWASDDLAVVDLAARSVTRVPLDDGVAMTPMSPRFEPYAAALHPTDGTVWVSSLKAQDLRLYDPKTGDWDTARGPIDVGGAPFFGVFSADGAYYYAPVQGANAFVVVDATTGQVVTSLPLDLEICRAPHAVLLTANEAKALVVCEGDQKTPGTVVVVNLANPTTPAAEKAIEVGVFPDDAFFVGGPR